MDRYAPLRTELAAATRLAAPVALVQLGMMLMGVVDTMMLGHVSAEALAAGALGHVITFIALIFGYGILTALDPLIGQAYGAKDAADIRYRTNLNSEQDPSKIFFDWDFDLGFRNSPALNDICTYRGGHGHTLQ